MKARICIATLAALGPLMFTPTPVRAQLIEWTLREVSGPSSRDRVAIAYDAARGVIVLFGGSTDNGLSGETWEWNGTVWIQRMVSGPSPRYVRLSQAIVFL